MVCLVYEVQIVNLVEPVIQAPEAEPDPGAGRHCRARRHAGGPRTSPPRRWPRRCRRRPAVAAEAPAAAVAAAKIVKSNFDRNRYGETPLQ